MSRPLLRKTISDLEQLFAISSGDTKALNGLKNELKHRNVPKAIALLKAVDEVLALQGQDHESRQMPLVELQTPNA